MSRARRWLEELPADCAERELLLAGKSEQPSRLSVDRGWQSLSATLGIASATTLVSAQVSAQASAQACTATGLAGTATASTAAPTVGLALVAKAIAVGFTLGLGLLGTNQVAQYAAQRSQPTQRVTVTTGSRVPAVLAMPPRASVASSNLVRAASRVDSEPSVVASAAAVAPVAEAPHGVPEVAVAPNPDSASSVEAVGRRLSSQSVEVARSAAGDAKPEIKLATKHEPSPDAREPTLTDQARDLAQIKRLVDAGAFGEALRRLQSSYLHDDDSTLSEERDALYIDALAKTQHLDEAKRRARLFIERYPSSPHLEKMRSLNGSE